MLKIISVVVSDAAPREQSLVHPEEFAQCLTHRAVPMDPMGRIQGADPKPSRTRPGAPTLSVRSQQGARITWGSGFIDGKREIEKKA